MFLNVSFIVIKLTQSYKMFYWLSKKKDNILRLFQYENLL